MGTRKHLIQALTCFGLAMSLVLIYPAQAMAPIHKLAPKKSFPLAMSYKSYAKSLVLQAGGTLKDWKCVDAIYTQESHWNFRARNSSSGATGIPQSLPAEKMAVEGADYLTNPYTQIRWGQRYFKHHWNGEPCVALAYKLKYGSY